MPKNDTHTHGDHIYSIRRPTSDGSTEHGHQPEVSPTEQAAPAPDITRLDNLTVRIVQGVPVPLPLAWVRVERKLTSLVAKLTGDEPPADPVAVALAALNGDGPAPSRQSVLLSFLDEAIDRVRFDTLIVALDPDTGKPKRSGKYDDAANCSAAEIADREPARNAIRAALDSGVGNVPEDHALFGRVYRELVEAKAAEMLAARYEPTKRAPKPVAAKTGAKI